MEHLQAMSEAMGVLFWIMFYGCAILFVGAILVGMMHGIWVRYRGWRRMERERDESR